MSSILIWPRHERVRVAQAVFSLNAVLGILTIGGAALYAAAFTSENAWTAFFVTLVPFLVLWALFCYGAYKGLTSANTILKFVLWSYIAWNVFTFPAGTIIAGVTFWLWWDIHKRRDTVAQ
ncbi:MAG: hypothetical protein EXR84_06340 [Gammaproteobacteria bacterium]|nr:hypothetical protein [Gammaproteobacteria bacterium]